MPETMRQNSVHWPLQLCCCDAQEWKYCRCRNPKIGAQRALLSCKVICSFLSSLLPSALLFIPEWPLWIMRCSKGNRDNGSTLEAANRHWDKVIQHLTRKCCVFASSSEQRDGSLLINADSLKSTLCQRINNKLAFREGYIAMKRR